MLPRGPIMIEFACIQLFAAVCEPRSRAQSNASNELHFFVTAPLSGRHSQIASPTTLVSRTTFVSRARKYTVLLGVTVRSW